MGLKFLFRIILLLGIFLKADYAFAQDSLPMPECGIASYYSKKWDGRRTSSGEKLSSKKNTAAHRTLPFGTLVRVTDPENCNWVIVKINDRGPHIKKRIIDLSWGAAKELGIIAKGLAKVEVEVIGFK